MRFCAAMLRFGLSFMMFTHLISKLSSRSAAEGSALVTQHCGAKP
jgi:hypothetical protein